MEDGKIIAYTYDWGMVTDLARRNISRMCGALDVEHILISANIRKKLDNINKNINAWLKKPHLGTVPIFMAGDKQYFYYMNRVKSEVEADGIMSCFNPFERTDFKSGFCNVNPFKINNEIFFGLDVRSQFQLLYFFGKEFLRNPAYLNSSLFDSSWAYFSYYILPKKFLTLYDFVPWNEKVIEESIIDNYG